MFYLFRDMKTAIGRTGRSGGRCPVWRSTSFLTIADFGGWREAQLKYLGDGDIFDQIYAGTPAQ
jgi:ABC-type sulfate transport system substrate-binding protein